MLYPILTESRLLSDLSGVWDFKLDNGKGFDEKWYEAPLKDADTMPVPASYNDLKEGADFRDHYGWVFYQRNISVPSYVKSQRIVLRCAAVTHYAKIYLNGNLICEHKGGFLPFEVELNDVLEDGDNLLTTQFFASRSSVSPELMLPAASRVRTASSVSQLPTSFQPKSPSSIRTPFARSIMP